MGTLLSDIYGGSGPPKTQQEELEWIVDTINRQKWTPLQGSGAEVAGLQNDLFGSSPSGSTGASPSGWQAHPTIPGAFQAPDGTVYTQDYKSGGLVPVPGTGPGNTGKGSVQDLGNGYAVVTQPDGTVSIQRTSASGGGSGAQFNWGISEAGMRYAGENALEQQRAANEGAEEQQRIANEGSALVAKIQAETQSKIAQIEADSALSAKDKDVQIAGINAQAGKDAAEAQAAASRYVAELDAQEQQRRTEAEAAIAQGQVDLGMAQIRSAEKIAMAKAELEREVAGLQAYTQLLGIESQERSNKAQAAASVFKSLADATPGQQLKNAYYFLRGAGPPPTMAENLPSGLLSALGLNADTVSAAAKQMEGKTSVPPFLAQLMKGQLSS